MFLWLQISKRQKMIAEVIAIKLHMKILSIFISLALLSGCCIKGIETGRIKVINESSQFWTDSSYKFSGNAIILRPSGGMAVVRYKKGKRSGLFLFYNSYGFLYLKEYYKNDSLNHSISYTPRLDGLSK